MELSISEPFHVITAVSRPQNLVQIADSLAIGLVPYARVVWWLVYDAPRLPPLVPTLEGAEVRYLAYQGPQYDEDHRPCFGHAQRSHVIDQIDAGWVWVLDDDTICHPRFGRGVAGALVENPFARAVVVGQQRREGYKLPAAPDLLVATFVDTAQYVVRRDLIGDDRVRLVHADDGMFIGRLYKRDPASFVFVNEVLCYHNRLV